MKNTIKLYVVEYVEKSTLNEEVSIRTHSKKEAKEWALYLKDKENVLYAQVTTYLYDKTNEIYKFNNLKNYYKF